MNADKNIRRLEHPPLPWSIAEELLEALKIALLDHQRIEPHHTDMCQLCRTMEKAIAKAEATI